MLAVDCDRTHSRVLVFSSDVRSVDNTADGVLVRYRCACGQPGMMVTGRRAGTTRSGHTTLV